MGADIVSTLVKAEDRAAIKSLEKVDTRHGRNSTILVSTLVNILFNTCSAYQLIQLGSECGLKLPSSFNAMEEIVEMEKRRVHAP